MSKLCSRLDAVVEAWNNQNLREHQYPFLMVDAIVVKVREDNRVRSRAILIAIDFNDEGQREIPGMMVGDSESEKSWKEFFTWLKSRNLRDMDFVIFDSHSGLAKAVKTAFQGCAWQRCQVHFMRNLLAAAPKKLHEEIRKRVRGVLEEPDQKTARVLATQVAEDCADTAPKVVELLESAFDDVTAILVLKEMYRVCLRTTNNIERLNGELRRRESVIRIFPNWPSATRRNGTHLNENKCVVEVAGFLLIDSIQLQQ